MHGLGARAGSYLPRKAVSQGFPDPFVTVWKNTAYTTKGHEDKLLKLSLGSFVYLQGRARDIDAGQATRLPTAKVQQTGLAQQESPVFDKKLMS